MDGTLQIFSVFENPYGEGSIKVQGMGGVDHNIVPSKNLYQDLSMRCQTCYLNLLEVGFSAAQAQAFFDKLQFYSELSIILNLHFFSRIANEISKWTMSSSLTCLGKNFHINLLD